MSQMKAKKVNYGLPDETKLTISDSKGRVVETTVQGFADTLDRAMNGSSTIKMNDAARRIKGRE
jgi:hypothetical protein